MPAAPAAPAKPSAPRRELILKAAGRLFRRRGFHGTSTREVAEAAGISLGNIYNHFPTKEALFVELLKAHEREYFTPDSPLARAFAAGAFPENLEAIGEAARDMVRRFADYIRLIYVDVVEFDARHVGRLFSDMRERYAQALEAAGGARLADGIDPAAALMLVTWSYFNYFTLEKLFGVKSHYGMSDDEVIRFFAQVFRRGLLPKSRSV